MSIASEAVRRTFYILPKIPRTVQIEVTNRCNLNCKMCPRKYFNLEYKDMPFNLFKKIIERLDGVKEIILTGWGEPLIHPKIFDMIKHSKKSDFEVRLTTNGILLNSKLQKKLMKSGLDSITFSVDSIDKNIIAHWNKSTLKNIEQLINLREDGKPKVIIQTTMHKNKENDIYDVIRYAGSIRIDRVNLARLDVRFNRKLKRPTREEEKEIFEKAVKLGKTFGISVDFVPIAIFDGLKRKLYKMFRRTLHRFDTFCPKTYAFCYVNINGFVTPCCSLPNYEVGNLMKNNIKEIWNSRKFGSFRRNQNKICAGCDIFKM